MVVILSGCFGEETIRESVQETVQGMISVDVNDAEILRISSDEITIDTTIVVTNDNPFGGTFNKITYDIYFKDERPLVGSGEYEFLGHSIDEKKVSIGTGHTILHTFFELQNRETVQTFVTLSVRGQVWIKFKGTANLDLEAISYNIPFEREILVLLG